MRNGRRDPPALAVKRISFEVSRELKTDPGSAGDGPAKTPWRDLYVDARIARALSVEAGRFKLPFGLEELTGETSLDFVERSLAARVLSPGRDVGVMTEMKMFARMGIPSPREAHARVYVNNEYAGLYVIVEAGFVGTEGSRDERPTRSGTGNSSGVRWRYRPFGRRISTPSPRACGSRRSPVLTILAAGSSARS